MRKRIVEIILMLCAVLFVLACSKYKTENEMDTSSDSSNDTEIVGNAVNHEDVNTKESEQEKQETEPDNVEKEDETNNGHNSERKNANEESVILDYLSTVDEYRLLREFWEKNRIDLENVSKDMKAQGIAYFINDVPFAKDGLSVKINENTENTDVIQAVLNESKDSFQKGYQFGWSENEEPVFKETAEKYFYFSLFPFKDSHGNMISLELVYSGNTFEDIKYYTNYVALSPEWLLVLVIYQG